ncbi:MAG: arginine--tRNA ligase [Acidobacteriota bacterium]|jgi:arginyl-tRNA synthetase
MLLALTRQLEKSLLKSISERYGIGYDSLNFALPPKIELGELALPIAFDLARKVKRPPFEIARELASDAEKIQGIWKADVAGKGYLNFHIDRDAFTRQLAESIEQQKFGRISEPEDGGKIIVEHTNINPNKAAHIGHLRNASLGDSFVRCLRFLGHEVEVQNYLDNTGVQVADVVVGLERMLGKTLDEISQTEGKFDYYCWDVYAQVNEFYQKSDENRKWRSRTLQAIEAGDNNTAELAQYVAMRIAEAHLETMARINVRYDLLPRESEILHLKFWDKAYHLLQDRKAIYFVDRGKNSGCWVMNIGNSDESSVSREEAEEDEKIIVRSDGTVTYVGKDIAYQLWKLGLLGLDFQYKLFEANLDYPIWVTSVKEDTGTVPPDFGHGEKVYNVIDSRQAYLQNIVVAGLKALGFEAQAENSIHFSYEMVALTPACCEELGFSLSDQDKKRPYVEVSGRKGLGVKADDLLDTLYQKALIEVRSRHELPEEESAKIAHTIAVGALRYFLLRFSRNTIIAFDFKEALNFEGETGPYIQYAVVRANNIFNKLAESAQAPPDLREIDSGIGEFLIKNDDIWAIVYQAARLPEVVRQLTQSLELGQLCKFAFSLAQKFNLFYHRHHILSETDSRKKQHLLLITDLVRKQLETALYLIGSEVPPRM